MITPMPEACLRAHLDVQNTTPGAVAPAAFAEYPGCYRDPACIHAVCEDYRVSVSIDVRHQEDDGGEVAGLLHATAGARGTVGQMFDVAAPWRREAADVLAETQPCDHLIPAV